MKLGLKTSGGFHVEQKLKTRSLGNTFEIFQLISSPSFQWRFNHSSVLEFFNCQVPANIIHMQLFQVSKHRCNDHRLVFSQELDLPHCSFFCTRLLSTVIKLHLGVWFSLLIFSHRIPPCCIFFSIFYICPSVESLNESFDILASTRKMFLYILGNLFGCPCSWASIPRLWIPWGQGPCFKHLCLSPQLLTLCLTHWNHFGLYVLSFPQRAVFSLDPAHSNGRGPPFSLSPLQVYLMSTL